MLQSFSSGDPVPHDRAPNGCRQDGESQDNAEGDTTLADALQAVKKG